MVTTGFQLQSALPRLLKSVVLAQLYMQLSCLGSDLHPKCVISFTKNRQFWMYFIRNLYVLIFI